MRKFYFINLCIFSLFLFIMTSGQEDKKVTAKLESRLTEGQLGVKAIAINNTNIYQNLNYLLFSIKKGSTGNLSDNKQLGKFSLNPGEIKKLSEISISLNKNEAVKVFLYIKDEDTQKLISKDSTEIDNRNTETESLKNTITSENDIKLKGFTIDDTKSKIGKDFYDMFYIQYNLMPEKDNSTITISELPIRGISRQIIIMIDDKSIYSFIVNPNDDYLKEQLVNSFRYIKEFNNRKNLIKNEFTY